MSKTDSKLQVRRPRHWVKSTDQVAAWVSGNEGDQMWHTSATLVDVSRHGCRLFSERELQTFQSVTLTIDLPDSEVMAVAAAEVRWRLEEETTLREYGLEFQPALEWEFLGELFLSGMLAS